MNEDKIVLLTNAILDLNDSLVTLKVLLWIICLILFSIVIFIFNEGRKNKTAQAEPIPMFDDNKAEILLAKGEHDELIDFCDVNLECYPNDVRPNWYIALAYYQLGNLKTAQKHFEKVMEISPSYNEVVIPYMQEIEAKQSKCIDPH